MFKLMLLKQLMSTRVKFRSKCDEAAPELLLGSGVWNVDCWISD